VRGIELQARHPDRGNPCEDGAGLWYYDESVGRDTCQVLVVLLLGATLMPSSFYLFSFRLLLY